MKFNRGVGNMGCFAAFISIFYIAGFGMLGYGLWSIMKSTEAAKWPVASGTIHECRIEEDSDSDGTSYSVKVKYEYEVHGRNYTCDTLAFGYAGSSGREAHEEIYDKLNKAKTVDVRYDPADPSVAVLSYGVHRSIQLIMAFAVTWLAFVVGFTLLFWLSSQSDAILLQNISTR